MVTTLFCSVTRSTALNAAWGHASAVMVNELLWRR